MNSETAPGGPDLADVGACAVVEMHGKRSVIRLRTLVDQPVALAAVWPYIRGIVDPADMCRALIDGAFSAPMTEGDNALTEMVDLDQILAEEKAAADAEVHRQIEEAGQHREMMERHQAEYEQRNKGADKRQARAWALFNSPARLRHDRAKAQAVRLMQTHCASLQTESELAAREAAEAAATAIREAFINRRAKIEAAFHAGKEWRNI